VCVPYQEAVTVTRMVPQYVQRQVQVGGDGCGAGCGGTSYVAACDHGRKRGLFKK
jgi:hypothetical protein